MPFGLLDSKPIESLDKPLIIKLNNERLILQTMPKRQMI